MGERERIIIRLEGGEVFGNFEFVFFEVWFGLFLREKVLKFFKEARCENLAALFEMRLCGFELFWVFLSDEWDESESDLARGYIR